MPSSLTLEQLKQHKKIEGTFKIKAWIKFFESVYDVDSKQDELYYKEGYNKKETRFFYLSIWTFFFNICLGVFLLILEVESLKIWLAYLGFWGVLLVFFLLYIYYHDKINAYMQKEDINNHYVHYLLPLLYFLKHEIGEESKVYIKFDNAYIFHKTNANKIKLGDTLGSFHNQYHSVPIHLHFFLDRAVQVVLDLQSLYTISTLYKRNPRNRIKIKHKGKGVLVHQLRMSLPKEKYIENANFTPYQIKDNQVYFKFKHRVKLPKVKAYSVNEIERKLYLENAHISLDEVIHQVHHLHQFIRH